MKIVIQKIKKNISQDIENLLPYSNREIFIYGPARFWDQNYPFQIISYMRRQNCFKKNKNWIRIFPYEDFSLRSYLDVCYGVNLNTYAGKNGKYKTDKKNPITLTRQKCRKKIWYYFI